MMGEEGNPEFGCWKHPSNAIHAKILSGQGYHKRVNSL